MLKFHAGIYKPYYIKHRKTNDDDDLLDESKIDIDDDSSDNIIRVKSAFPAKVWPNQEIYDLWSNYLNFECIMRDFQALNTMFLCVKTFENATLIHIQASTEK